MGTDIFHLLVTNKIFSVVFTAYIQCVRVNRRKSQHGTPKAGVSLSLPYMEIAMGFMSFVADATKRQS